MRKSTTLVSALAIAGLALAGGSAFTGGGLNRGAGVHDVFVGGTVSQFISGATLTSVVYTYVDPIPATTIAQVDLVFTADAEGYVPSIVFGGAGAKPYVCTAITALTFESACTPLVPADYTVNMESLAVTLDTVIDP